MPGMPGLWNWPNMLGCGCVGTGDDLGPNRARIESLESRPSEGVGASA